MRLSNLRFPDDDGLHDLIIRDGKIAAIDSAAFPAAAPGIENYAGRSLDLDGALAFPGLINSHDHLDFNCFLPLANRTYRNYTEWGADIHANNQPSIRAILDIPQDLRIQWGIYKNLLNGFTTVVNHGQYLNIDNAPINIFQDCYCLHSVRFEPRWKWKLNHPARRARPFAIHVGEGTDPAATGEIDELIRWNLFHRPLIGIHGVAMTVEQALAFRALVWCPAANFFLLDRTAPVDCLNEAVPILFGTDSTLTAGWNAWEHLRMARGLRLMTDRDLLATLTTNPAAAWKLHDRGSLAPGKAADVVIARPKAGLTGMEAFFAIDPDDLLLVIQAGGIKVFDASLLETITQRKWMTAHFQPVSPGGKYIIGDLPGLLQQTRRFCPEAKLPVFNPAHQSFIPL